MQKFTAPSPRAVWGLWVFFTAAAMGFVVLLGGLFGGEERATLAGAALMAFATLVYLFIHFWTTAHAAFSAAARPAAVPAPASVSRKAPRIAAPTNGAKNFEQLLDHTLERVTPPEPVAVSAPGREERLFAEPHAGPAREHIVPAAQRRNEWIGGLPIIKQVLGETAAVTAPDRPGKTRGQCSNCLTILWAPKQRPIRLRCPECGKVAWLEK